MITHPGPDAIRALGVVDLAELVACADLSTRIDRKYLVPIGAVDSVLNAVAHEGRALEIDGSRWFAYRSVYFDTPDLVTYRLAATARPHRFKVRTREYPSSGVVRLEVKTRDRRGRTVKRRADHAAPADELTPHDRTALEGVPHVAPHVAELRPTLVTEYERATLLLADATRATVDRALRCTSVAAGTATLPGAAIVETKSPGRPSVLDRALWRLGHRPTRISKYAAGLASIHDLPANRWHRVVAHFAPGALTEEMDPCCAAS